MMAATPRHVVFGIGAIGLATLADTLVSQRTPSPAS
jgi:hypothetical protein